MWWRVSSFVVRLCGIDVCVVEWYCVRVCCVGVSVCYGVL